MKFVYGKFKDYFGPYQFADLLQKVGISEDKCYAIGGKLPNAPFEFINKFRKQNIVVKIEPHDTWNMDTTLAYIIVPMLKQLKENKNGIPAEFIHPLDSTMHTDWGMQQLELLPVDEYNGYSEKSWNDALDAMIWSFNELLESASNPEHREYYWVPRSEQSKKNKTDLEIALGVTYEYDIDRVLMEEYYERMQKGFDLFGKHYCSLWD